MDPGFVLPAESESVIYVAGSGYGYILKQINLCIIITFNVIVLFPEEDEHFKFGFFLSRKALGSFRVFLPDFIS